MRLSTSLFKTVAAVALTTAVIGWLMFRVVEVQAGRSPPGELTEQWMSDVARYREVLYAENFDKTKHTIWIVGGSNGLFGINSRTIAERTGYNVRNYALHAGLNHDLLFSQIRGRVMPGDLVVDLPEWSVYDLKLGSQFDYTNYLKHMSSYLNVPIGTEFQIYLSVPLHRWVAGFFSYLYAPVTSQDYWQNRSISELLWEKRGGSVSATNPYSVNGVSSSGDFNVNGLLTRSTWLNHPRLTVVTPTSKTALNHRKYWAHQFLSAGAKLYTVAPVTFANRSRQIASVEFWASIESVRRALEKDDLPLYCDPLGAVMSSIYRLDTAYHANAEGAKLHSEHLGDCIRKIIDGQDMTTRAIDPMQTAKAAALILDQQKDNFGRGSMRFQTLLRSLTEIRDDLEAYHQKHGEYPSSSDFFETLEIDDRDDFTLSARKTGYYIGAKTSAQTKLECTVVAANWPSMIVKSANANGDLTLCDGYGYSSAPID